jgi:hypothetical protein
MPRDSAADFFQLDANFQNQINRDKWVTGHFNLRLRGMVG